MLILASRATGKQLSVSAILFKKYWQVVAVAAIQIQTKKTAN